MEYNKGQKRYLSRRECGWCEQRLWPDACGSCFGAVSDGKCTPELRADRRARCLEGYKPKGLTGAAGVKAPAVVG